MTRRRWEYLFATWTPDPMSLSDFSKFVGFVAWLEAYGADGWELIRATSQQAIGFIGTGGYRGETCLFKREKE